jgi:hypothetical protein
MRLSRLKLWKTKPMVWLRTLLALLMAKHFELQIG